MGIAARESRVTEVEVGGEGRSSREGARNRREASAGRREGGFVGRAFSKIQAKCIQGELEG